MVGNWNYCIFFFFYFIFYYPFLRRLTVNGVTTMWATKLSVSRIRFQKKKKNPILKYILWCRFYFLINGKLENKVLRVNGVTYNRQEISCSVVQGSGDQLPATSINIRLPHILISSHHGAGLEVNPKIEVRMRWGSFQNRISFSLPCACFDLSSS